MKEQDKIIREELILNAIKKNISYKEICKQFKCGHQIITKIARKNNILTKNMINNKRIVINNPFSDLNNENVQYWLGFLAGDGNIFKSRISLGLQEIDEKHIDKYIKFIGYNLKKKKVIKNNAYICYRAEFKNKEVSNFLEKIGITKNKSYTINYKGIITKHFLRGIVDSDGYIRKNHFEVSIITASKDFAKQIQSFIINELNLNSTITIQKERYYRVGVYGKNQVEKLLYILYNNANTYLERKYLNASLNSNIKAIIP